MKKISFHDTLIALILTTGFEGEIAASISGSQAQVDFVGSTPLQEGAEWSPVPSPSCHGFPLRFSCERNIWNGYTADFRRRCPWCFPHMLQLRNCCDCCLLWLFASPEFVLTCLMFGRFQASRICDDHHSWENRSFDTDSWWWRWKHVWRDETWQNAFIPFVNSHCFSVTMCHLGYLVSQLELEELKRQQNFCQGSSLWRSPSFVPA